MIILTYKIFDFTTPDSNRHMTVDKGSFMELINSEKFKTDLKKRRLVGALTHKCRDEYEQRKCQSIGNQFDWVVNHPDLNNVMIDLRVEGNDVYADLLILDTEKGKLTQMLRSVGIEFEVSVSTYSKQYGGKWKFMEFNGVDLCGTGALSVGLDSVSKATEDGNIAKDITEKVKQ